MNHLTPHIHSLVNECILMNRKGAASTKYEAELLNLFRDELAVILNSLEPNHRTVGIPKELVQERQDLITKIEVIRLTYNL